MASGLVQLGDHSGEGVTDSRYFRQSTFVDQLIERPRTERQVLRGAAIGSRAVGIAALELHALAEFTEDSRNCFRIALCHVRSGCPCLSNWAERSWFPTLEAVGQEVPALGTTE